MQIMNITALATRSRWGRRVEKIKGAKVALQLVLRLSARPMTPRRFAYATRTKTKPKLKPKPKPKSSPNRGSCVPFVTQSVAPAPGGSRKPELQEAARIAGKDADEWEIC